MKAVAERLPNNRVALQIEVEAERVDAALERAYRKLAREVNIPGFRKGKAPRKIIEARFGVEVLYEDALEELVPEAYREAIEANAIEPIDQPSVSDVHIEAGRPLTFRAEVEVMPEAELGEYKGIKVVKEIEAVEESDIDHALEHLQDENAELVAAERDVVEEGDVVTIDFEGYLDGKPFQGGAAKGYTLEVGSGQFIEGFEEQLVGARAGEEKEVSVKFPEDYPSETLRGKDVVFKVTVQAIKVRRVPELDDEFARDVSDAQTLDELKNQIRSEMEEAARARADREVREKVVDALTDASSVELPKVLVEREIDGAVEEFARRLMVIRGIRLNDYLEQTEQTIDDVRERFRSGAERRVKASIVLETLIKRAGITVSEEELQARIEEIAAANGDAERVRRDFERPERRSALRDSMAIEKAIDFLVEHADIEEKIVPSRGHGHHHHHHDDEAVHEDDLHDVDDEDFDEDFDEEYGEDDDLDDDEDGDDDGEDDDEEDDD